jgi:hypothetical protein
MEEKFSQFKVCSIVPVKWNIRVDNDESDTAHDLLVQHLQCLLRRKLTEQQRWQYQLIISMYFIPEYWRHN